MDKVQKYNSFNTNTPSSESYRNYLLLLLCKISILIYASVPALQNFKDTSAVKVRSSSSQPASHGFVDCLFSLVAVTSQMIFQGIEQVVVGRDHIRTVGRMGEQFPAVLWNCLQGQTFQYPKISTISWSA
jgi:hypothetical protein